MKRKKSKASSTEEQKRGSSRSLGVAIIVLLLIGFVVIGFAEYSGTSECGNGRIDSGEQCDGSDLNSKSCSSYGFAAGALRCTADCQFDTKPCTMCGNAVINKGEQCDAANLAGKSCASLGLGGGILQCKSSCLFDKSRCTG